MNVNRPCYKPRQPFQLMATAFSLLIASSASAFNITSAISGWWEQPNEQNHGLVISTSQLPDGSNTGVIFWAHYDTDGEATWLLGQGDLVGNAIEADLYQVSGVNFMQPAGSVDDPETLVGSLTVTLDDCNRGNAAFDTTLDNVGSGQFAIARLTQLPGLACSGGITDDIPATSTAERFFVSLEAASGAGKARGTVEWVLAGGTAELEIEIENVSVGDYRVIIGGIDRGEIIAQPDDDDDGAEGEIEFYSPQRGFHPLLNFDPRGQVLAITLDGQTVLSATMPTQGSPVGIDTGDDDVDGERSLRQIMTNAGVFTGGTAVAEWEQDDGYVNFEVDVDDIPAGRYSLLVDTIARGMIDVREDNDGDTDGEIEFYSPARAGYAILDFDPRGALIEVVDGSTTLFFADFPATGDASTNPGGNNDGPGDDDEGPGDDDEGPGDDDGDWSGYDQQQRFALSNQGVYPQGVAIAELTVDREGREFEIELENIPAGDYVLTVGGVSRGTIRVFTEEDDDDGGQETEGEIEFSEQPDDNDELLLDFTVRGEVIEILEGNTVIFSGTFPTA